MSQLLGRSWTGNRRRSRRRRNWRPHAASTWRDRSPTVAAAIHRWTRRPARQPVQSSRGPPRRSSLSRSRTWTRRCGSRRRISRRFRAALRVPAHRSAVRPARARRSSGQAGV